VQLSITHANLIAQGVAADMGGSDQSSSRDMGAINYSRLKGMMLQAWSPFQMSFFDGFFIGDRERRPELSDELDRLASAYGVTPTGIAVAWITRQPANMLAVMGPGVDVDRPLSAKKTSQNPVLTAHPSHQMQLDILVGRRSDRALWIA
jgi:predicted oxidoreductase